MVMMVDYGLWATAALLRDHGDPEWDGSLWLRGTTLPIHVSPKVIAACVQDVWATLRIQYLLPNFRQVDYIYGATIAHSGHYPPLYLNQAAKPTVC